MTDLDEELYGKVILPPQPKHVGPKRQASEWVTDEEIEAMTAPSRAISAEQSAQQTFRKNAPLVAQEIATLALSASNERVRLAAGQYLIDRVLGKAQIAGSEQNKDSNPWDEIYGAIVVREPSAVERKNGSTITHEWQEEQEEQEEQER